MKYSFTDVVDDTDVHALIKKPKKCNAFFRLFNKIARDIYGAVLACRSIPM